MAVFGKYPVFQYAYLVNDIEKSIWNWHKLFCAGPFVIAPHHKTERFTYRGTKQEADVSYAFGYCGDLMIQFIEQHDVNAAYFDTRAVNGGFTEIHGDPPHILEGFKGWRDAHRKHKPADNPIIRR